MEWHENDNFWEEAADILFTQERMLGVPQDIDRLLGLAGIKENSSVLDAACGQGRYSIELASRGFKVTAFDRQRSFLDIAQERAMAAGVQPEFVEGDMRFFRREETFDLVLNLFTSFGFFEDIEDDRKAMRNMVTSLKPGGKLIMDVMGKEILARKFAPKDWQRIGNTILLEERQIRDGWERVDTTWTLFRNGTKRELKFSLRLYSAFELKTLALEAGLKKVEVFGNYLGSPYDIRAERLVLLGTR